MGADREINSTNILATATVSANVDIQVQFAAAAQAVFQEEVMEATDSALLLEKLHNAPYCKQRNSSSWSRNLFDKASPGAAEEVIGPAGRTTLHIVSAVKRRKIFLSGCGKCAWGHFSDTIKFVPQVRVQQRTAEKQYGRASASGPSAARRMEHFRAERQAMGISERNARSSNTSRSERRCVSAHTTQKHDWTFIENGPVCLGTAKSPLSLVRSNGPSTMRHHTTHHSQHSARAEQCSTARAVAQTHFAFVVHIQLGLLSP